MTNPATKKKNQYNRQKAKRRAAEAAAAAYAATIEDLSTLDHEQEDWDTHDSSPPPLEHIPQGERWLPAHFSTPSSSSSGPPPTPRIPRVDYVDNDEDGNTSLPPSKLPVWPPTTVRDMGVFLYIELGPMNGGNNVFLTTPNGLKDKISKGIVGGPRHSYKVLPYHPYFFEIYNPESATKSSMSERRELAGSHPLKVMERISQTRGLFSLEDNGGEEAMVKEAREEILKVIAGLERQVSMMGEPDVSTVCASEHKTWYQTRSQEAEKEYRLMLRQLEPITTVQQKNPLTLKPKKSVTKGGGGGEEVAAWEKEFVRRTKTEALMTLKKLTAQFLAKTSFWLDLDTVFVVDERMNPHQQFRIHPNSFTVKRT